MNTLVSADHESANRAAPARSAVGAPGDTSARAGAVAGIAGIVLQIVMSLMHPSHADPNDSVAAFREYAGSDVWTAVHIGQFLGTALIAAALVALARMLMGEGGVTAGLAMAAGGLAAVIVAVFAVQMAVDGVALKATIATWLDATTPAAEQSAFQVADGVRAIEKGLSGFFQMVNGLALLALGTAVVRSRRYASWLGWVGAAAGVGAIAGGTVTAHTGFSATASMVLMVPTLCTLVFVVGVAVYLWRRPAPRRGGAG